MRRPRIRVPRPRLPRPKLKRPARPRLPDDAWFRFVTRIRAVGYWIREKAQIVARPPARAGRAAAALWAGRSPRTRRQTAAVAAVAGLYLLVKLVAVPGVPCELSAAKECAPEDATITFVPDDALLYGHLTLDRDSRQFELAAELGAELPNFELLVGQLIASVPIASEARVDLGDDVLSWAEGDLAVALLPGPGDESLPLLAAGIGDASGADRFLELVAGPGEPSPEEQEGSALDVYPGGLAAARAEDTLLLGPEAAVRASLDAGAGRGDALDESAGPRGELPRVRFADLYLSRAGVARLLAGGGSGASQLGTFVNYGATEGMAISATARDDGVKLTLISELDPGRLGESPTVFAELPEFEPELAGVAGERALGYIGVGEIGPTLESLLEGAGGEGLARAVQGLAESVRQQAGVDAVAKLLPALEGQAALVAEPTDGVPFASLIVEGVQEDEAAEALAALEATVLELLAPPGRRQPGFEESEVEGVVVRSARLSATVDLAYSLFDGMLVISTDPAGIARVRAGGNDLAGSEAYERATGELPGEASALVFLNLDELLGLATQAGLAEDPLYATLSDDISRFGSLGLAVSGSEEALRTELFLASD